MPRRQSNSKTVIKSKKTKFSAKFSKLTSSRLNLFSFGILVIVLAAAWYYLPKFFKPTPVDVMEIKLPDPVAFVDNFNDTTIDTTLWTVKKSSGVTISETTSDNLKINVPKGKNPASKSSRAGSLLFKKRSVMKNEDYTFIASIYRPIIKTVGTGASGIRFSPTGTGELVEYVWETTNTGKDYLVLDVTVAGKKTNLAKKLISNVQSVELMLRREDNTYEARYRFKQDDDTMREKLVESENTSYGSAGKMEIFTSNLGQSNQYPELVGRFDKASFSTPRMEGGSKVINTVFLKPLDSEDWNIHIKNPKSTVKTIAGNLVMNVAAGSVNNEPSSVFITAKQIVGTGPTRAIVDLIKPEVNGVGNGIVGIVYQAKGAADKEDVSIRWVVSKSNKLSQLVFRVTKSNGQVLATETVDIPPNITRLSSGLNIGEGYATANYQLGLRDGDREWKQLAQVENIGIKSQGYYSIQASNTGNQNKYPALTAKVDLFSVRYW